MTTPYRPRLSVEIPQSQFEQMNKYFKKSERKAVFITLIDNILELIKYDGREVIDQIIKGERRIK